MNKKIWLTILAGICGGFIAIGVYQITFNNNNKHAKGFQNDHIMAFPAAYNNNMFCNQVPDFTVAAAMTLHSVVHIKTEYHQKSSLYDQFFGFNNFTNPFNWIFPYNQRENVYVATGSGVIISSDGYIATNNHVVQDADAITVTLNDKYSYNAKIVGTDPSSDIALIKIDAENLPFIKYGNSDSVKIGEWVLAVGNPFNLTSTVTAGIVSAKSRNINVFGGGTDIKSFIQTDAAVNPGNSGGALVNTRGELIGINTAIASNTGSYTGYSFAIPVNIVRKILDDLLIYGVVQKAYLGVTINEINADFAQKKGIKEISGVYVEALEPNGAAADAGIKEGDIIININGTPVNSLPELLEVINQHRPGEKVNIDYKRNGNIKTAIATLKNKNGTTDIIFKNDFDLLNILGATFEQASEKELKKLGLQYGVKVTKVEAGKFKSAGIKPGFIITSIDRKPVKTVEDVNNKLNNKTGGVLIEGIYPNGIRVYYGLGL